MKESPVFSYIEIILLDDACIENSINTHTSIWRWITHLKGYQMHQQKLCYYVFLSVC